MDTEQRGGPRPIETEPNTTSVRMSYQYKDAYGRLFGSFESLDLNLESPATNEAEYFDGSIETPYGSYMLECKIAEATKAIAAIKEYMAVRQSLEEVDKQLKKATEDFNIAILRMQNKGDDAGYLAAMQAERDIKTRREPLKNKLIFLQASLAKYKV